MGKSAKFVDDIPLIALSDHRMFILLLNSIALGMILVIATFYEIKYLSEYPGKAIMEADEGDDDDDEKAEKNSPESIAPKKKAKGVNNLEIFLGASNLLFLCVGLTGIMLLVEGSIARAFAIAAALALTRFRIKLDQKSINASLLFAILAGMACGLEQVRLAWMATGIYLVLFLFLLMMVHLLKPQTNQPVVKADKKPEAIPPAAPPVA